MAGAVAALPPSGRSARATTGRELQPTRGSGASPIGRAAGDTAYTEAVEDKQDGGKAPHDPAEYHPAAPVALTSHCS